MAGQAAGSGKAPEKGLDRVRVAFLALVFLALPLLAEEPPLATRGVLRAEFWSDLNGVPQGGDPWSLPLPVAAERLADEAAYVFAGQVWGFDFEWTPSDKARSIKESFVMKPSGSIPHADPRLVPGDSRVVGQTLRAYVSYSPSATELSMMDAYGRAPWKSAQGTGYGDWLKGLGGRKEAYEDAARDAIRNLLRGLEPNKPRRVRGRAAFDGTPRIAVVDGAYRVQARFRIDVTDVLAYGVY